jgi:hypothetical protein
MLNRLEEIKEMDKSSLKSSEKKELRKEVREIKSELKRTRCLFFCRSDNNHYSFINFITIKNSIPFKRKKKRNLRFFFEKLK